MPARGRTDARPGTDDIEHDTLKLSRPLPGTTELGQVGSGNPRRSVLRSDHRPAPGGAEKAPALAADRYRTVNEGTLLSLTQSATSGFVRSNPLQTPWSGHSRGRPFSAPNWQMPAGSMPGAC